VVAIMSLLLAMLLPALNRAKYEARMVACKSNLRQQSVGVTSYTSNHAGRYPTRTGEDTEKKIAPTLIRSTDHGVDYRDALLPYFGSMNRVFTCPMAPATYLEGGAAVYGRSGRDLDTSTAGTLVISYAQWYGRIPPEIDNPNLSDPAWGTGSVVFDVSKGMKKLGEHMELPAHRPDDQGRRYRVLASDAMWLWNSSILMWTHETPGEQTADTSFYGEFTGYPTNFEPDFNYVKDDGSAHSIRKVKYDDPRVTLTTGRAVWGWGWIVPID